MYLISLSVHNGIYCLRSVENVNHYNVFTFTIIYIQAKMWIGLGETSQRQGTMQERRGGGVQRDDFYIQCLTERVSIQNG